MVDFYLCNAKQRTSKETILTTMMTTMATLHHTTNRKLLLWMMTYKDPQQRTSSPSSIPSLVDWRKEKQNETDKIILGMASRHLIVCVCVYYICSSCFLCFSFFVLVSGVWFVCCCVPSRSSRLCSSRGLFLVSILFRNPFPPHHVSFALQLTFFFFVHGRMPYVLHIRACVYVCVCKSTCV